MAVETNTPAQKARLKLVREMLARGENPYTLTKMQEQGGLASDRAKRLEDALKVQAERSEARTAALEAKWRERVESPIPSVTLDDLDLGPFVERDPLVKVCSFCGKEAHYSTMTTGKTHQMVITQHVVEDADGHKSIEDRIHHRTQRPIACPECILQLKPKVNAEGTITYQGIDFPETEG